MTSKTGPPATRHPGRRQIADRRSKDWDGLCGTTAPRAKSFWRRAKLRNCVAWKFAPLTDGWLLARSRATGPRAAACCFVREMCWGRMIGGRSASSRVAD